MKTTLSFIAASLLFASVPTQAAEQTAAMDMRCFMVASAAVQNITDPEMKQMAMLSSLFYLGRASARLSDAEMETVAITESKALSTVDIQALLQQCGAFMAARGEAIDAIGQRMAAKAEAEAKKAEAAPKK
ncbi:hypothetical protein [Pedomonas sp. V897]|uniref:hypothetical protein n=1 Tax=Pedomonas sp. V897 TaxID=3446482 RepID=UPI003EE17B7C